VSRLLVIMGSGETAPTMVKPHREIFAATGDGPAVLLDTPYGFQENADKISSQAVGYFGASVGRRIDVVGWRTAPEDTLDRERALAGLRAAAWVFAGPGSPTYALRHWRDTPVPDLLADKLLTGGTVVFASAAALTLGSHTIPVYEIYKAGADPHWVPGLDLVAKATGLPVVVIPHYDNAEGGHHDTRYCYLGERRLAALERELPDDGFVLGVDEHTACVIDLDAGTVTVRGNGRVTVRRRARSKVFPAGSALSLSDLATAALGSGGAAAPPPAPRPAPGGAVGVDDSLRAAADRLDAAFSAASAARDVDGCVAAILDLDQVLVDWSADTLTSDESDHARGMLRTMVIRLGELARPGVRDPREVVGPYVEALLALRRRARDARDFATSDAIRDRLAAAGIEVHDTPAGATWDLR